MVRDVDFGEDKTNCLLSSTGISLNDKNKDGDLSGRNNEFNSIRESFKQRVLILSTKYKQN